MNKVFVGGSRNVSRLSPQVQQRLQNVTVSGAHVIVGDANGADKAVQKFLLKEAYENVTVYYSGDACRNNLGHWQTRNILTESAKGFGFYAAKDREMAREADFGLMIWDGKSFGTLLNILRLLRAGKKAVLLSVPDQAATTFGATSDWQVFLAHFSSHFQDGLRKRATTEEWISPDDSSHQPSLFEAPQEAVERSRNNETGDVEAEINAALATGDPTAVVNTLGNAAKTRGMSQVAKETGLARESLYRSLSADGNPEFATVFKVISSMGLRLMVSKAKIRDE